MSTYEELSELRIYEVKWQKDDWSGFGMLKGDHLNHPEKEEDRG